jgi:hypothetical protein
MILGLVAIAAVSACGGSSAEEERQRLADDLVEETDGALDDDTARCVADALHDEYGDDSFQQVIEAASNRSDDDAEVRTEVIDIFASCDALEPIIDDGS